MVKRCVILVAGPANSIPMKNSKQSGADGKKTLNVVQWNYIELLIFVNFFFFFFFFVNFGLSKYVTGSSLTARTTRYQKQ